MKSRIHIFLFGLMLMLLCLGTQPSAIQAQSSGTLAGTIFDAKTGESLIGATVYLPALERGTATDIDGKYTLANLPAGEYTLVVSSISYIKQNIEGVQIQPGEVLTLDIVMESEVSELEEVTVTATAVTNNEAAMLSMRRKAISMSDAISSENISRSGSGNAAQALTKVTGASVIDGKYVYVRGLGDRYTSAQLNGMELPSSNPDKKTFQLDLLPSSLIENIVTLKTFTPDKPGSFSGGLVDVKTKSLPDYLYFNLSAKQGYNTNSSARDILLGDSYNSDLLGFDSGDRDAPALLSDRENSDFPNDLQARFDPDQAALLNNIANSVNPSFLPTMQSIGLNQSWSIGFGNRVDVTEQVTVGFSLNHTYGMSYDYYESGRYSRFELLGQYEESETLNRVFDLEDQKGQQSVDWGILGTAGLSVGQNHRVNFSYVRTQSGENTGRYLRGFWEQFNSEDIEYRSRVNQYRDRDLHSYQLSGKHYFPSLNGAEFEWNSSLQQNGQTEPDLRFISSQAQYLFDSEGAIADTLLSNPSSQFPRPARFFRELDEEKMAFSGDITIPLGSALANARLKAGALYEQTERSFFERRYEYQQGRNFSMNQFEDEESFLNTLGVIGQDNFGRAQVGNYIISATSLRSSYDAEQTIAAAYGMVEATLFENLKIAAGARYEATQLESVSRDTTLSDEDRFGTIDVEDILPSVNVILNLSNQSVVRAAATQTLARPTFRELSPYVSFDFLGDNLFRGSSQLERTLINNYDLRWEWYPSSGEILAVSGFYKYLKKPIERVLRFDISQSAESVQNVDAATVYGIEFELRKRLGFMGDLFRNFQLTTNLSLVQSEVTIPEAERIIMEQTRENPPTKRELAGQSPYIINADLYYSHPDLGFQANLSFNKFGDRLSRVSVGSAPDVYERSFSTLNLNAEKSLGRHFTVQLSVKNLLNPNRTFSQIFKDETFLYQQYRRGVSFDVGVKYNL
ncbi:MAG: hypothetical protein DA443_06915 [Bacteroidetes bacterium]|nr:MAG: hypothetical protein DA443_06915 [Bacteroidota bacterium]